MKKYEWLEKRTPRSVDQLRLWPANPRLNPSETHLHLSDYADDLTSDDGEKKSFFKLVLSIVEEGFIAADPVVVWQDQENKKYYVAEGNRRLVALKLLRDPSKAPKSIRSFIRGQAAKVDISSIEKIPVNVAPTFDDAEWYINQRNSASSIQRPWSRAQQQKWISDLYHKYNGDMAIIMSKTRMTNGEIEGFIRITKFSEILKEAFQNDLLTEAEYEAGAHYKFPMTVLERFFGFVEVQEKWGFKFSGINFTISSDKASFLQAYTELIKGILDKDRDPVINTRFDKDSLPKILASLPIVLPMIDNPVQESPDSQTNEDSVAEQPQEEEETAQTTPTPPFIPPTPILPPPILKNNLNRPRLVLKFYTLKTDSGRLFRLFNELKEIPLKYNNSVAASIRVFLDLAILNYLRAENLENTLMAEHGTGLNRITLSTRIEFLKQQNGLSRENCKILNKLLKNDNEYSLDVLNGFIHSDKTHYLTKQFLNGFWDFLFPLFQQLLDINETK